MLGHTLTTPAAETATKIVTAITPDSLTAPTPCAEFDVRALVNHLLYWGPSLQAAATKHNQPPPTATDLVTATWQADLTAQLVATAQAWSDPEAWEGTTPLGGQDSPAPLIGGMVLVELVVHTWDLARAIDQQPDWSAELLTFVHHEVENHAAFGREMGTYGPEVPQPPTAPLISRIVALTGRHPSWPATD